MITARKDVGYILSWGMGEFWWELAWCKRKEKMFQRVTQLKQKFVLGKH